MPLNFDLESPTACPGNNPYMALPYVSRGWNSTGSLERLYLGHQAPDMEDVPRLLMDMVARMDAKGVRRDLQKGLAAFDVVKLCDRAVHDSKPNSTRKGSPRMERLGAIALVHAGAEPIEVRETQRAGQLPELLLYPPIQGTGPVKPAIWMESTPEERGFAPVTQAVLSVPFGNIKESGVAFIALRGHEKLYCPPTDIVR